MMMILMSLMFMGSSQPMVLAIVMFFVSVYYSVYLYMKSMTLWYGFILMLIVLSGVLVIFTYMASISPNERFSSSEMVFVFIVMMGWVMVGMNWGDGSEMGVLSLWSGMVMVMNMYMIVFLLVMMLMVVWISEWWVGPVRC